MNEILYDFLCKSYYKISDQGIYNYSLKRNLRYDEELCVPIIENTPFEKDLEQYLKDVMEKFPESSAVLVRRHGIYVWGDTWQRTKAMLVKILQ